jgi:hypothetical protein
MPQNLNDAISVLRLDTFVIVMPVVRDSAPLVSSIGPTAHAILCSVEQVQ